MSGGKEMDLLQTVAEGQANNASSDDQNRILHGAWSITAGKVSILKLIHRSRWEKVKLTPVKLVGGVGLQRFLLIGVPP